MAAEDGTVYALSDREWLEFLNDRADGLDVAARDYGISVGAFVGDTADVSPESAARLLAGHEIPGQLKAA